MRPTERYLAAGDAVGWMKPTKSYGELVDIDRPVLRRTLRARLPNQDIWIPAE